LKVSLWRFIVASENIKIPTPSEDEGKNINRRVRRDRRDFFQKTKNGSLYEYFILSVSSRLSAVGNVLIFLGGEKSFFLSFADEDPRITGEQAENAEILF
jgi:hypothetical protein